jgi:hypothetical protein
MVLCAQVGRTRFTRPLPCGFSLSHTADSALDLLACIPRVGRMDKLSHGKDGGVIALAHNTCVAYRPLHQRVPRALHGGPTVTRVHHAATTIAPTTWHRVTFLTSTLQGLLHTSQLNHWSSRTFNNNDVLHRKMMVRIQHWLSHARSCFRVRLERTRNSNRSTILTSPHRFRARRILERVSPLLQACLVGCQTLTVITRSLAQW